MTKIYISLDKETKEVKGVSFLKPEEKADIEIIEQDAPTRNIPINYLADVMENAVNGGCLYCASNALPLVASLHTMHRYLQNEFIMNFIVPYLHEAYQMMLTENYDGRNEHGIKLLGLLYELGIQKEKFYSSQIGEADFKARFEEALQKIRG